EARREMRRPLGVSERHLVGGTRSADRQRECDLEQRVLLLPVDGRVELDPPRARIEAHDLAERACLADTSIERDVGAQRAGGNDLARVCGLAVAAGLEVRGVDVPR